MANASFDRARKNKEDEFYTQTTDIEAEMRHYKEHFRGKVILCNCDDPYESNFFKYFALNFKELGLKKVIATSYSESPVAYSELPLFKFLSLAMKNPDVRPASRIEIADVSDENADGAVDLADVENLLKNKKNGLTLLNGDGDFRSPECVELLKTADIVVTNPPFSLFREYVAQLIEYDKNFIIIGNQNAITYKEIFPLLRDNKLWMGYNSGDMEFVVPDYYTPRATRYREENGTKYRSMGNTCWFTNIDVKKRHESITLYKHYTPDEYPRYVNYNAIEVSKVAEIPRDYDGEMGVPITFLDKYNPEQFEIIGSSRFVGKPMSQFAAKGTYVQGGIRFYLPNGDGTYRCLYDRIVIKRKGNPS